MQFPDLLLDSSNENNNININTISWCTRHILDCFHLLIIIFTVLCEIGSIITWLYGCGIWGTKRLGNFLPNCLASKQWSWETISGDLAQSLHSYPFHSSASSNGINGSKNMHICKHLNAHCQIAFQKHCTYIFFYQEFMSVSTQLC